MLTNFIRNSATEPEGPVIKAVESPSLQEAEVPTIQVRARASERDTEIYTRAREIYLRARKNYRHRAVSIF